jgi:hypothetical protein
MSEVTVQVFMVFSIQTNKAIDTSNILLNIVKADNVLI